MRRLTTLFFIVGLLAAPAPAVAQEPYTPLVPGGTLRFEMSALFTSYTSRFGVSRRSGGEVEADEPLGIDFTADPVGVDLFPALTGYEAAVSQASGQTFALDLGAVAADVQRARMRLPLTLDFGLTDWLNLGVTVPLDQHDVSMAVDWSADSLRVNTGLSPGVFDPSVTDGFLGDLQGAISGFTGYQMAECQADPGSAACTDATALLMEAQTLHSALATMYTGFFLAPMLGSAATVAIEGRLTQVATGFSAAGVTGTPSVIPVATFPLSVDEFQALITDPRFGTGATYPLQRWLSPWAIGDIEVRAGLRLLNVGELGSGSALAVGGQVTYRLGTGRQPDPANPLDLGTGDGQDDIELRGWLNGQIGSRLGVWTDLRYGLQQEATTTRRVFDPDFAYRPASTEIALTWAPGDYQLVELSPWFRVAESLTFIPSYQFFRKGEDTFTLLPGDASGLDPTVLRLESEMQVQRLALGFVYNTVVSGDGPGFEFRALYRRAIAGSGGQTPDDQSFEATLRLLVGAWGR
ncbi:MAG: hypothetical protein HKO53_16120 [Gemmatimonadetes bacterium]|nr:hypothetical protein [Gemmatimonadota bacterium]